MRVPGVVFDAAEEFVVGNVTVDMDRCGVVFDVAGYVVTMPV